MGALVLDASAALHLVLDGPRRDAIRTALRAAEATYAPTLYVSEVANGLWKCARAGTIAASSLAGLHETALALVDRLVEVRGLFPEALGLAAELGHPVHDTLYPVLARRMAAQLVSLDRRLGEMARCLGIACTAPGAGEA